MTSKQLRKQLKNECDMIIPNKRERLLLTVGAPSPKKTTKTHKLKWLIPVFGSMCLCVILALSLLLPLFTNSGNNKFTVTNSVVVLEVNPVFEVSSGADENVTKVRGLNKQAVMLLDGGEGAYNGKSLTIVVADITKLVASANYIKNDVTITATCGNSEYESQLEQKVTSEVKKVLTDNNISANVSGKTKHQDSLELSKKYKVSQQKMSICLQLVKNNSSLKIEELVKLDTDDLLEMLYGYDSKKMDKFVDDLAKNNKVVEDKKNEILKQLDDVSNEVNKLLNKVATLAEKSDIAGLNTILTRLNQIYVQEIFDEQITLENYQEFADVAIDLKEELAESIAEARDDLNQKYDEWVKEYQKVLKEGVDADDDFDFDDLNFDFELDLDFKLPTVVV